MWSFIGNTMLPRNKASLLNATACLGGIALLALLLGQYIGFLNHAKADLTLARMRQLENLLLIEGSGDTHLHAIQVLSASHGCEFCWQDAWGNAIIVEKLDNKEKLQFRLVSLGRDGKLGNCCKRFIGSDWDADAVRQNEEWLQNW